MSETMSTTAAPEERRRGVQHVLEVVRSERLSPGFVRLHFGGSGVEGFLDSADPEKLATSDKYVKMLFAKPETGLTPPYDLDALRERLPQDALPSRRTYTVRSVDTAAQTIAIDFVIHGDEGLAGPWAAQAQPGDRVALSGPGGGYAPTQEASAVHLLVGDESALPAIAATLESLPSHARGVALIEVFGPDDQQQLVHPLGVRIQWLHRSASGRAHGALLLDAVRALHPLDGEIAVFAHGERGLIKQLRTILTDDWGVERRSMSLSPYWALGRAEDAFQAEKRTPIGAI